MLLQAARQSQTEEEEMAVAPMLLQCGFMSSHSQACCCRGGSHMCHSPAPWLTYRVYSYAHTNRVMCTSCSRVQRGQFRPLSAKVGASGYRYIGAI